MIISSIELTSFCNLKCFHCLNANSSYPKGYVTLDNFAKAIQYSTPNVGLSLHGEPLLHPEVCEFIKIAKDAGRKPQLSTNGLLLKDDMCESLVKTKIDTIEIGIYSEKALFNYKRLFEINESLGKEVNIIGDIYLCYLHDLKEWAKHVGLEEKHRKKIRISPMHNWANEPVKYSWEECIYTTHNRCVMKWDGKIVSCCFDFDGVNYIGEIDDFAKLKHRKDYRLCDYCSPSWVHHTNDIWYDY